MATKTVILRPTSGFFDSANNTRYPSETLDENVYLLVAEEIADDDATYYVNSVTPSGVYFSVPTEYTQLSPSAIRVVIRGRAYSTNTSLYDLYIWYDSGSTTAGSTVIGDGCTFSNIYQTSFFTVPEENINAFWTQLLQSDKSGLDYGEVVTNVVSTTSNGKNLNTSAITQIYLEVDFEDEEPSESESSGIYIKNNSVFIEASYMYHKIAGAWAEITADECKSLIQMI